VIHRFIICISVLLITCGGSNVLAQQPTADVKTVSAILLAKLLEASREVDRLIEAGYAKHNVTPNEPVGDQVFMRRVYLDVVGPQFTR